MRSRRERIAGIVSDWTGVGEAKPKEARASERGSARPRREKDSILL